MHKSPEYLLKRYHEKNDQRALTSLIHLFHQDIYHYLLTQSSKEIAEDVIQTMWIKVMNSHGVNMAYSNTKAWLFSIARNTLIDSLRKDSKIQFVELSEMATQENISAKMEAKDKLERFNKALMSLSFYQREAIVLQQEGFSLQQIAELIDENIETVKSRIRYAKNNLKALLGSNHD